MIILHARSIRCRRQNLHNGYFEALPGKLLDTGAVLSARSAPVATVLLFLPPE